MKRAKIYVTGPAETSRTIIDALPRPEKFKRFSYQDALLIYRDFAEAQQALKECFDTLVLDQPDDMGRPSDGLVWFGDTLYFRYGKATIIHFDIKDL